MLSKEQRCRYFMCLSLLKQRYIYFLHSIALQRDHSIHLSVGRCLSGSQRELESIPAVSGRVTRTHIGKTCKLHMESHVWWAFFEMDKAAVDRWASEGLCRLHTIGDLLREAGLRLADLNTPQMPATRPHQWSCLLLRNLLISNEVPVTNSTPRGLLLCDVVRNMPHLVFQEEDPTFTGCLLTVSGCLQGTVKRR